MSLVVLRQRGYQEYRSHAATDRLPAQRQARKAAVDQESFQRIFGFVFRKIFFLSVIGIATALIWVTYQVYTYLGDSTSVAGRYLSIPNDATRAAWVGAKGLALAETEGIWRCQNSIYTNQSEASRNCEVMSDPSVSKSEQGTFITPGKPRNS